MAYENWSIEPIPSRRLLLAMTVFVIAALTWPQLGRSSGTIRSMRELSAVEPIGDGLDSFPALGEIRWEKYPERPRRVRLTGRLDVDRFYSWAFGRPRPPGDTGMYSISRPLPSGNIGKVGDRVYEAGGTTGDYRYDAWVLLDGQFQLDVSRRR